MRQKKAITKTNEENAIFKRGIAQRSGRNKSSRRMSTLPALQNTSKPRSRGQSAPQSLHNFTAGDELSGPDIDATSDGTDSHYYSGLQANTQVRAAFSHQHRTHVSHTVT